MAKQTGTALLFRLSLDGRDGSSLFTEANGGGSRSVVLTTRGLENPVQSKDPGTLEFSDITLRRSVDADRTLWDWRQQVVEGKIDDARCGGTLEILDGELAVIVRYAFDRGWPSSYTPITMDAGQDKPPGEELTIVVENFRRE
jgi:phage tail-like protein